MSRKKKRGQSGQSSGERARTTQDFLVEVQHFEIASGYDGLLRGAPEVSVAIGIYSVGARARTLARAIFRAAPLDSNMPQVVPPMPDERSALTATDADDPAVLVIACGVEDDDGGGLARVFGALERADDLAIAHADDADLVTLNDVTPELWGEAKRALVVARGVSLQKLCIGDDWVGAAAMCVKRVPGKRRHRLHLASDDFVNDWTVVTSTKIGWRA